MLDAAFAAASQILTPPFRWVLWKTLALTFALLALVACRNPRPSFLRWSLLSRPLHWRPECRGDLRQCCGSAWQACQRHPRRQGPWLWHPRGVPINNEIGWLPVNQKTVLGLLRKGVPHPDMKIMPTSLSTKPGWRIGSRSSRRRCILQVSRLSVVRVFGQRAGLN
jgi:hypothetical protein